MDVRGTVKNLAIALVIVVFVVSIICYGIAGVYFFADGLRLQSGGGILLGLACWGGVALFSLPLWLLFALRLQRKIVQQQKAQLQNVVEILQDSSRFREISRAMTSTETKFYE
jgi:uncharacterized membrane protein